MVECGRNLLQARRQEGRLRALQEAGPLPLIEDPQRRDIEVAALSKLKTGELAERAEHDLKDTGWLPHLLRTRVYRSMPILAHRVIAAAKAGRSKTMRSRTLRSLRLPMWWMRR